MLVPITTLMIHKSKISSGYIIIMYIKTNYDHTYLIYELNLLIACVLDEESIAIGFMHDIWYKIQ